jgi:signal transduction histidine kinase/PAS domain-containing protein
MSKLNLNFNYRQINRALIQELSDLVACGQSVALFSPRFGGKRHVMDRVREECQQAGLLPIVQLRLLHDKPLITDQELNDQLRQALALGGVGAAGSTDDPFQAIECFAKRTGRRVILFAANLDAIAQELTRRLLQGFRKLVESRCLVVVLSGESDFHGLVHGENSEFTSSENYFLQCYSRDEFGQFLDEYVHTLNANLNSREEILEFLWNRTGGSAYLLRLMIVEAVEKKARFGKIINAAPITIEDFLRFPTSKSVPGYYWTQIFRYASRMVAWAPECWKSLEQLLRNEPVAIEGPSPTPLEWFGIAMRRDGALFFASEMMENYARLHFDDLRFGDLYARIGMWPEAFSYYERLEIEQKRRPLSAEDRTEIERVVNSFEMALFTQAAIGEEELKHLFVAGCRHLLGFSEITFWRREDQWRLRPDGNHSHPSLTLRENVNEILADSNTGVDGLFVIPEPWSEFALAARLQSARSDYICAVIVSDLEQRVAISRERKRLVESLLRQFIEAHTHAVTVLKKERRLTIRNQQVNLINSVFKAMGSQVLDVDGVIKRAAAGLRVLGAYSRVLFCLVDPKRERIRGVFDYSDDLQRVNVAEMTDYPLNDPESDIQPHVIATKHPFVTDDTGKERLTNKQVVKIAEMKAMAIVPILNHAEEAIGTIHIERYDKLKPTPEEVEDLMDFGKLLATAIEQAERVNLLQSALDRIPDPVAIVGALGRFRYANKAAADNLNVNSGWQERADEGTPLEVVRMEVRQAVREAFAGQRIFVPPKEGDHLNAILADYILNWRKETVGALLRIQEQTDFDCVFRAFLEISSKRDTEEAMDATLEATKILGYEEGRLYSVDHDSQTLISKRSYGMANADVAATFDRGEIKLPFSQSDSRTRLSFEQKQPFVFCYDPNGRNDEERKTAQGLKYRVVTADHLHQSLRRNPGDFWVNVPLLTNDRPLGMITLMCDEYLRPESFELLKMFSEVDAKLLDEITRQEREQYERELDLRAATAQKVMADVAHNIATRFGSFPGFLKLYRYYEGQTPGLKELNDDFEHALELAQNIVKRSKERLSPIIRLQRTKIELFGFLRQLLKSALPENTSTVSCGIGLVEVEMDAHLFEVALLEMIENSKAALADSSQLKLEVRIVNSTARPARQVEIIYRDNGPGIPEDARKRIFEDFFSYRPGKERASNGLGMGYTKRVIEAHGGQIEVGNSRQGAEFVITLPRHTTSIKCL